MSELLLSAITFAVVTTISPGGATTLATASGAQFGLARSVPLLSGIALGLGTLVASVAGGLGSLVLAWPVIQVVLRVLGSAYLLWLAWIIARLGSPKSSAGRSADPIGFAKGFALLWMNPKGWTMAVAAAGAFAGLSDDPSRLALLLGTVFGAAASFSLTLWCLGGSWLSRMLRTEAQWRVLNGILGLLLACSVIPMWV